MVPKSGLTIEQQHAAGDVVSSLESGLGSLLDVLIGLSPRRWGSMMKGNPSAVDLINRLSPHLRKGWAYLKGPLVDYQCHRYVQVESMINAVNHQRNVAIISRHGYY